MARGINGKPEPFPMVPEWLPPATLWEGRTLGIVRGTPQLLKALDRDWSELEDSDSASYSWVFHTLGKHKQERWVLVDSDDNSTLGVWLDHDGGLVSMNAYRLDFFKVRPDANQQGLGTVLLNYLRLRAKMLSAQRIVFQSTSTSDSWWRKKGAIPCNDWKGLEQQANLQLSC